MQPSAMHLSARRAAVALAMSGLLLSAVPPAPAAAETLVTKTVRIGSKPVRFVLAVSGETASVKMQFKRKGSWRTVASDKTDCPYDDASRNPKLEVQKADDQVLVGWSQQGGGGSAEYGGYRIKNPSVDMYGSDSC